MSNFFHLWFLYWVFVLPIFCWTISYKSVLHSKNFCCPYLYCILQELLETNNILLLLSGIFYPFLGWWTILKFSVIDFDMFPYPEVAMWSQIYFAFSSQKSFQQPKTFDICTGSWFIKNCKHLKLVSVQPLHLSKILFYVTIRSSQLLKHEIYETTSDVEKKVSLFLSTPNFLTDSWFLLTRNTSRFY